DRARPLRGNAPALRDSRGHADRAQARRLVLERPARVGGISRNGQRDHRRQARSEPGSILLRAVAGPRDGMIKTPFRLRGSSNPKGRPFGVAEPDAAVILAALALPVIVIDR